MQYNKYAKKYGIGRELSWLLLITKQKICVEFCLPSRSGQSRSPSSNDDDHLLHCDQNRRKKDLC